jgi:hypothetical protein
MTMHDDRKTWLETLPWGLPPDFDFGNIRNGHDASRLIGSLPNPKRGIAAKRLYEHRHVVGNKVAYRGLMEAWNHDHHWVLSAFGSDVAFTDALCEVAPVGKRRKPIIAWRGTSRLDSAYGLSWTTSRDIACWFATRSGNTPYVFRAELSPEDIVTSYNGRSERELIINPRRLIYTCVTLADGGRSGNETYAGDIMSHEEVSPATIAKWRAAGARYGAFIRATDEERLRKIKQKAA